MRRSLLPFVMAGVVLAASSSRTGAAASIDYVSRPTPGVSLILTSDKRTYHEGDDPVFTIVLQNMSSHQIAARALFRALHAVGPSGSALAIDPKVFNSATISLGGPLARYQQQVVAVTSGQSNAPRAIRLSQYGYSLKSPGTYTFQVTETVLVDATLGLDKDITVWKSGGQLEDVSSNELSVTVQ